jgi:choice-of-anchor B domain-containing protein
MRRNQLVILAIFLLGTLTGCGDNMEPLSTIGDHVRANSQFSSLESALRDTDLLETLDGPGPYTLFAFTNGEFDPSELPSDRLRELAQYHIHEGALGLEELKRVTAASTLEGTEIHVRNGLDGILLNDGSVVGSTPIIADNGVIHIIDRALSRTLFTETTTFKSTPGKALEGFSRDGVLIEAEGYIHDLRVTIDIAQTDVSSLYIFLRHSDTGALINLVTNPRSTLSDVNVTLADSATFDIVTNAIRGDDPTEQAFPKSEYRAAEPLEYLVGEPSAGVWELTVFNFSNDPDAEPGILRSWGMEVTIGSEIPAPALVFNPRNSVPEAFAQQFTEVAIAEARRVGGLEGELEFTGTMDTLTADPVLLPAEESTGALLFRVPESADVGQHEVSLAARVGDVSRIAFFDSSIVTPQSDGMVLAAHVSLPELGAIAQTGSDIWGWTDPMTGADIALVGTSINTAFVDVSIPESPKVLGTLPTQTDPSTWRDIKVYKDHAFIVSEAEEHGLQVFDLTQLRTAEANEQFTPTVHINEFGSAHNIAINEETGTAYVVGTDLDGCNGGILVYDITTPTSPVSISCFSGGTTNGQAGGPSYPTDVYTHDVQCVTYAGPDTDYTGRELCFSSDEQTIAVADFSDLANPAQIVRMTYDGVGYTHQGWLTEDQRYFIVNDEFDEFTFDIETRSYVWDLLDIDSPQLVGTIDNPSKAVGHNTYITGSVAYQANYSSGLRLVDVSDLEGGLSPEVAYYDTNPNDDAHCRTPDDCGDASFDGAWSNYPFFASGTIIVSDTLRGLFVLRRASN